MTKKTRGRKPTHDFNFNKLKIGKTIKVVGQTEPNHFAHLIRSSARNKGMQVSAKVMMDVVYLTLVGMLDK